MDYICTWIYLDSPDESSEYPQVGKGSHLPDFQKVYWKCVAVFFATSIRFNPERNHVLFSNKKWDELPVVDGFDMSVFLREQGVTLETIPLSWQTPPGYFGKWRNQFYIFDILKSIEAKYSDDDRFVILDSDCVINRPLDGLFKAIEKDGLLVLPMPYTDTANINGVTREDMKTIFTELDGKDTGQNPLYYGGEVFAATTRVIRKINNIAPGLWEKMMERHQNGQVKLNEEAHFLSYCYYKIGVFGLLDQFIKRIWTSPQYSNVESSDVQLPIWHLPSEKKGGIALLFKRLKAGKSIEFSPDEMGKYVGIPERTKWLDWKHFLKYTFIYKWLRRG